jgi:thiosulfate/3-mercaptopyruvate sulfurtransferase
MESLVSTEWLGPELGAPGLHVVDASWFLPGDSRDARAEYEAAHIPGAVFFDLDEISDPDSPLPHMLPSEARFASRMRSLGIGDGGRIVFYDDSPLHSAARAWWMIRTFGAREIALLDGGLAKWKAEGRPLESGTPSIRPGHFTPALDRDAVADKAFIAAIPGDSDWQIADARSPGRFRGDEPEPRPGLASGHIPGSRNLPFGRLFEGDGRWKRGDALRAAFEEAGIDLARPLATSCGSGVTAATLLFGAHLLGKEDVKLYDGSWAEWGADPAAPKAVGPA